MDQSLGLDMVFDGEGNRFLLLLLKYSLDVDIGKSIELSDFLVEAAGRECVKNSLFLDFDKFLDGFIEQSFIHIIFEGFKKGELLSLPFPQLSCIVCDQFVFSDKAESSQHFGYHENQSNRCRLNQMQRSYPSAKVVWSPHTDVVFRKLISKSYRHLA
jgi:hypothetical protein